MWSHQGLSWAWHQVHAVGKNCDTHWEKWNMAQIPTLHSIWCCHHPTKLKEKKLITHQTYLPSLTKNILHAHYFNTDLCLKKVHIKGVILCYPLAPVNRMQVVSLELTHLSSIVLQNFARRKNDGREKKNHGFLSIYMKHPQHTCKVHFISHYLPFTIYLHLINNAYLYLLIQFVNLKRYFNILSQRGKQSLYHDHNMEAKFLMMNRGFPSLQLS